MRLLVLFVLAGCPSRPAQPPNAAPHVGTAFAIAMVAEAMPPPPLVILEAAGTLRFAVTHSWSELDRYDPRSGAVASLADIARFIHREPPIVLSKNVAMPLEEGDMAKRESSHCEGSYCMPRPRHHDERAKLQARVMAAGVVGNPPALILAHPDAKARPLVDVLVATRGVIAVEHRGKHRPLRIVFDELHDYNFIGSKPWPLVTVPIEKIPDVDTVDVIVDDSATVQAFVDTLIILDAAGVQRIGIGSVVSR